MDTIIADAARRANLDVVTAGPLTGAKLGFFTNDFSPTRTTPKSSFVEPTGSWYTQATVAGWRGASISEPDGTAVTDATPVRMVYSGTDPAESVYGFFITDSAGALIASGRFDDAPRLMGAAGDGITVWPIFSDAAGARGCIEG